MRTVVLCSDGHLGSLIVLYRLLKLPEFEIVGILKTRSIPLNLKGVRKLKRYLNIVGFRFGLLLFWQQFIQEVVFILGRFLPFNVKRLATVWKQTYKQKISVLHCENVNSEKSKEYIYLCEPEIVVLAYYNRFLNKEIISIPKLGVINIHPGWLPEYGGVLTYFWILRNREKCGGVTIQLIDESIDAGPILARKRFSLRPHWTQLDVLITTAIIGVRLVRRVVFELANGADLDSLQTNVQHKQNYHPMPSKKDFKEYILNRRFFRVATLCWILWCRL